MDKPSMYPKALLDPRLPAGREEGRVAQSGTAGVRKKLGMNGVFTAVSGFCSVLKPAVRADPPKANPPNLRAYFRGLWGEVKRYLSGLPIPHLAAPPRSLPADGNHPVACFSILALFSPRTSSNPSRNHGSCRASPTLAWWNRGPATSSGIPLDMRVSVKAWMYSGVSDCRFMGIVCTEIWIKSRQKRGHPIFHGWPFMGVWLPCSIS